LFWLIDRKYFDRSSWEDYTENIINVTGILLNDLELKEFEKTIPNIDLGSSTSRKRKYTGDVANDDKDEDANDYDDDDDDNNK